MKDLKKTVAILGTIGILAISTAAYAAIKTPSQIVSGLTGKTEAVINAERAAGKTYGTIAKDAGKFIEFQSQMLIAKKAVLDQRVKNKTLTQAQADAIYNSIKANQGTCDGTGSAAIGKKNGIGKSPSIHALCPFGAIQEFFGKIGQKLFKRKFIIPSAINVKYYI